MLVNFQVTIGELLKFFFVKPHLFLLVIFIILFSFEIYVSLLLVFTSLLSLSQLSVLHILVFVAAHHFISFFLLLLFALLLLMSSNTK